MIIPALAIDENETFEFIQSAVHRVTSMGFDLQVARANDCAELSALVIGNTSKNLLVVSTDIDDRLSEILLSESSDYIFMYRDPVKIALRGNRSVHSIRAIQKVLCSVSELQVSEKCTTIDLDSKLSEKTLFDYILSKLGKTDKPIKTTADVGQTFLSSVGGTEEEIMIFGALDGFRSMATQRTPSRVVAVRSLFCDATNEGRPVTSTIDVTGRARTLVYGPYIYLPPGAWSARIVINFAQETVGQEFKIDVASGAGTDVKAHLICEIARTGKSEFNLEFLHTDPRTPIEFRVGTNKSAVDGVIDFGLVDIHRIGSLDTMPVT